MKNQMIKTILGVTAGAALGYAYYYFIGCQSGTCPLTSNPYITTAYGAGIGLLMTFPGNRKRKESEQ